ncbi:MAG TPA: tetratricopeptide repeat protein [Deltaproteobacteria bacterium]|nr:tetratricopeptide repeat protein [Deltaproteobacteria bacterium]HPJ93225.1 tetratricopeptide repeat protein [Deltaproteobacteria bacterium]HPR52092.1 tetratricopeptide repeat protein [Deltaproteobacteria bacterium]
MSLLDNLFGKKKASKEIRTCEGALEKRPDDPVLLKKLGDLYLKANKHENAADIYVRLGDTYNDKGFYPKAIALYKQAIKINPGWEKPHEKLAELYQVQGFSREAATQYVNLSDILEKRGESEDATMFMQKAAELDASHKTVNKKAQSFDVRETGMMDPLPKTSSQPAVKETDFYDLTDELDKEIEDLHIDASAENLVDDTGVDSIFKAIEETASEEGKDDPLFLYNMGLAYRETGLLDEAIESFKKVISSGEKLFDAHIMLGITYREKGQFEESLKSLRQGASLEEASNNMKVGILYEIAQTYKAVGDNQSALSIFRDIQKEQKDFKDVEIEIVRLAGGG